MIRALFAFALACAALSSVAGESFDTLIEGAAAQRREGNLHRAVEILESACAAAAANCAPRIAGELGAAYLQAQRFGPAKARLEEAYRFATDRAQRALYANDLGSLSFAQGRAEEAARYYAEARDTADDTSLSLIASLNLARLASPGERQAELVRLAGRADRITDPIERARYTLNLGNQARELGRPAVALAYANLNAARALAAQHGNGVLHAEALDALAQLYEEQDRAGDALKLTEQALGLLRSQHTPDLSINLQWRRGRLLRAQGEEARALGAYRAAVELIETIRQDIPITYVDGRSSFRETLEPIYQGLADLLLRQANAAVPERANELLRHARDAVELIKQSELQDYLGDRCAVANAVSDANLALPARTAVLYPIILADRLELLVETRAGISRRAAPVSGAALREKALGFADSLREAKLDYLVRGRELYDLLLRPIQDVLEREAVATIVIVPDGALRLVPVAALHDGERFAIEKFALVVAPGLTITGTSGGAKREGKLLLAGLSEPGPSVDKLPQEVVDEFMAEPANTLRGLGLRAKLALPGVKEEIASLKHKARSQVLLDQEFTVDRFRRELTSGDYRAVHIASHAVFNSKAQANFILAYDDLLTVDDLQRLLRAEPLGAAPLDMLTLSACETAEGDDRAPLGFAGAVLKARARSALGSLWPVSDEATKALMVSFYDALSRSGAGKGEALRQAQRELIRSPALRHPFFWAPFVLVGDWQ